MRRSIAIMRPHGTGSITIRQTNRDGPVYYAQWWLTATSKASRRLGPVRQPGSKTGLTQNMAEAKLRQLMAETPAPAEPEHGTGIRFPEAGRRYLTHLKRQGRKKSTLTAVESCLRVWAVPHLTRPLDRVTYDDIEMLVTRMEERGLSPKSIANYVGTISALFAYGLRPRVQWVTSNPCEGVELPAVPESAEIRFLTVEEVEALIRHVPTAVPQPRGHRELIANAYADLDRVLYRVAAMTGLRQGELIALQWQDVDLAAAKVRVRRNFVLDEIGTPKSRRSSRAVPLGFEVQTALAGWQPCDCEDDDLVFADPITAGPLAKAAILRRMRWALRAAGLKPEHVFHDLRHTFGTRMAAAGVPLRTIQEFMGHADIQTTMRYADYAPSRHEVEMVDRAFARPVIGDETSTKMETT